MIRSTDATALSPAEMERARKNYYLFAFFNTLSFQFLTGNILTLYALKIGAGNSFLGILSAFLYLSFFFMFAGRALVNRMGAVRIMTAFFFIRCVAMIPMLAGPFLVASGQSAVALALTAASAAVFNVARGIAVVGDSPILSEIGGDKTRGVFLSRVQVIAQTAAIFSGFVIAFFLGRNAPVFRYVAIIGSGVVLGCASSIFISRLPEPRSCAEGVSGSLRSSFAKALKSRKTALFFASIFLVYLIIAMTGSFLLVYFKTVHGLADSRLALLASLANVGALCMAILSGFTLDRLGSKPLYFAFAVVTTLSLIPAVLCPSLRGGLLASLVAGFMFFLYGMGTAGMGNAGQNYFLGMTPPKDRLNFGIIFYLLVGAGGTVGSLAGGWFLDRLLAIPGLSAPGAFRIFFSLAIVLLLAAAAIMIRLTSGDAYSLGEAIRFMLSPKDMRALALLRRLENPRTFSEEGKAIEALGEQFSALAVGELLSKVRSPSLQTRTLALKALRDAPLGGEVEKMLIAELKDHPGTTGHLAAEIIGNRRIAGGIPQLRLAMRSDDPLLAGASMVSLAHLGDGKSLAKIEEVLGETENPRLLERAIAAARIYGRASSVPILLGRLSEPSDSCIRDEIVLALSSMAGVFDWFYPKYSGFTEHGELGVAQLKDCVKEMIGNSSSELKSRLLEIAEAPLKDPSRFSAIVSPLLADTLLADTQSAARSIRVGGEDIAPALLQALGDRDLRLAELDRFRFLCAALIIAAQCAP